MTTVAYRDGVLAADRRVTGGPSIYYDICKLRRGPCGTLYAMAGATSYALALLDWLMAGQQGPAPTNPPETPIEVITISPAGEINEWYNGLRIGPILCGPGDFLAWGSGRGGALGAMAMGASARQAVEIAARFDCATGGKTDVLELPTTPLHEAARAIERRLRALG